MRLRTVTIRDFKRFTDLTIQNIPESTQLIVLAGPNGCGKSSFFDAFRIWYENSLRRNFSRNDFSRRGVPWEQEYHRKAGIPFRFLENPRGDDVYLEFHDYLPQHDYFKEREWRKVLYLRSAYRNDPEFQIQNLTRVGSPFEDIHVNRMIDNDAAVARNFQRLASRALEDVFDPEDGSMTLDRFRELIIGDIGDAFSKLFPDIGLDGLGNPLEDGTFRFTKGTSKGFSFKNLSSGEKSAFDLILDLVAARRAYDDTVFCIDEPESHMNARLQAELLSVLYNLIPEKCQLILATHSIGMMRRAQDIEKENPGSVAFLDFGDRDFDEPQTIEPTVPDRAFWNRAYDVALDDLAALVAPRRVVICEGEPRTNRSTHNHSLDADCYNQIFEREFPETRFVSMGSDRQIVGDQRGLAEALRLLIGGLDVVRLIDRDDRTDNEIADLAKEGVRVLSRRNLESYLFDDEVLSALAVSVDKGNMTGALLAEKRSICAARPDAPADDLKPASGEIYVACKKILNLTQCGNDAKTFMRDTLAPLVEPGMAISLDQWIETEMALALLVKPRMAIYEEMKRDVFDPQTNS